MSANSKQEKQFAVATAILEIIEAEGLLAVTHSKIARRSKVSRAWIYEYIGKEKGDLIDFAANELGGYFSRLNLGQFPKSLHELNVQLKEGSDFLIEAAFTHPTAIKLYYRYRGTSNSIGRIIQDYECKWIQLASKALTEVLDFSAENATLIVEMILTLRLGYAHRLVTSDKPLEIKTKANEAFKTLQFLLLSFLDSQTNIREEST